MGHAQQVDKQDHTHRQQRDRTGIVPETDKEHRDGWIIDNVEPDDDRQIDTGDHAQDIDDLEQMRCSGAPAGFIGHITPDSFPSVVDNRHKYSTSGQGTVLEFIQRLPE